jgi:hypothetical protein
VGVVEFTGLLCVELELVELVEGIGLAVGAGLEVSVVLVVPLREVSEAVVVSVPSGAVALLFVSSR